MYLKNLVFLDAHLDTLNTHKCLMISTTAYDLSLKGPGMCAHTFQGHNT